MIKFCKPTLGKEENFAVLGVIQSGWLAAGEITKQFEDEFAKYVQAKHAIFTNSGTAALKMAYKYMKEELKVTNVWTPKNTFSATYSAARETGLQVGYKMRFNNRDWDLRYEDPSYPPNALRVNVHYGGIKDETLCYLEDSAHRIEKNDPLIGKIRIYSFYVTKNMTTGAGGMFVTNDDDIYQKARLYWRDGINKNAYDRQHGGWDYKVEAMAGGYDGNDLSAAIGVEQLKKLPEFTKKRNEIRDRYNKELGQDWKGNHLYPYFVDNEEKVGKLIEYLADANIQASYHYPGTGWKGVSLPIYPLLTDEEQDLVIRAVLKFKEQR